MNGAVPAPALSAPVRPLASVAKSNQQRGTALIVGATSRIARCLAAELSLEHYAVHLAARNLEELERIAADLSLRSHSRVSTSRFEAADYGSHAEFLSSVVNESGELDTVAVVVGELLDQKEAERSFDIAYRMIQSNYLGVVSLLTQVAARMEAEGRGTIVVVSSVAGDRGRQSNYVYGSAKAGLTVFLEGLRNRLCKSGVHVLTVKPGYVDTKMTFGKPGRFLVARPEDVARSIMTSIKNTDDVLYVPWFWFWIMLIVRLIPEPIFKRLKL